MLIPVTKFNSLWHGIEEVPPSLQPKYGFRSSAPQCHSLKIRGVPPAPSIQTQYWFRFPQLHNSQKYVSFPQPQTQNTWILPSAGLQQKCVGFISLRLVSLKVYGLCFSQPHDPKYISLLFPSASRLRTQSI